jgi:hypothetical protein
MSARYGLPYIFEDKTGDIRGSEYDEVHERMRLCIRCTRRCDTQTAYMLSSGNESMARIGLCFGPNNALGTISIGQSGEQIQMDDYLSKVSTLGRFVISILLQFKFTSELLFQFKSTTISRF